MKKVLHDKTGKIIAVANISDPTVKLDPSFSVLDITEHPQRDEISVASGFFCVKNGQVVKKSPEEIKQIMLKRVTKSPVDIQSDRISALEAKIAELQKR